MGTEEGFAYFVKVRIEVQLCGQGGQMDLLVSGKLPQLLPLFVDGGNLPFKAGEVAGHQRHQPLHRRLDVVVLLLPLLQLGLERLLLLLLQAQGEQVLDGRLGRAERDLLVDPGRDLVQVVLDLLDALKVLELLPGGFSGGSKTFVVCLKSLEVFSHAASLKERKTYCMADTEKA